MAGLLLRLQRLLRSAALQPSTAAMKKLQRLL